MKGVYETLDELILSQLESQPRIFPVCNIGRLMFPLASYIRGRWLSDWIRMPAIPLPNHVQSATLPCLPPCTVTLKNGLALVSKPAHKQCSPPARAPGQSSVCHYCCRPERFAILWGLHLSKATMPCRIDFLPRELRLQPIDSDRGVSTLLFCQNTRPKSSLW